MNGILDLPWWGTLLATLCMTHFPIVSVTIYLHRHQAHRAVDLHPASAFVFRCWLWLTTGMTTKFWRRYTENITLLSRGAELYREEGKNQETLEKYGHGTPDDWLERHIFGPHDRIGVATMLFINLMLFGVDIATSKQWIRRPISYRGGS